MNTFLNSFTGIFVHVYICAISVAWRCGCASSFVFGVSLPPPQPSPPRPVWSGLCTIDSTLASYSSVLQLLLKYTKFRSLPRRVEGRKREHHPPHPGALLWVTWQGLQEWLFSDELRGFCVLSFNRQCIYSLCRASHPRYPILTFLRPFPGTLGVPRVQIIRSPGKIQVASYMWISDQ